MLNSDNVGQDIFLSTVAHELRTPLTSMMGFAQAVDRSVEKKLDNFVDNPLYTKEELEKQHSRLQMISKQIKRLDNLINDLLDVTAIENGQTQFNCSTVDINAIISSVCDEHQYSSKTHQIRLNLPNHKILIYGDEDRLYKLFSNLILNAFKYSPKSDYIDVSVIDSDHQVEISVQDYGIGIEEKDIESLFELYYRGKTLDNKKFSGLGLGLYFCKQIVLMHKGTISVESKVNKGSIFKVFLPKTG